MGETTRVSEQHAAYRQAASSEYEAFQFDLPTTPELARAGVQQFREAAAMLSSSKLRDIFLHDSHLKRCFVGTMPEVGLSNLQKLLTPNDFEELIRVVTEKASDIRYYRRPEVVKEGFRSGDQPALLNMAAARLVVQNNPDVFPAEAMTDPDKWLWNNQRAWNLNVLDDNALPDVRFGLLSGFPEWSAKKFKHYQLALQRLDFTNQELPSESEAFLDSYNKGEIEHDDTTETVVRDILEIAGPSLSAEECALITGAEQIDCIATSGYLGFDKNRDQAYVTALDNLYRESGIDDVGKDFD